MQQRMAMYQRIYLAGLILMLGAAILSTAWLSAAGIFISLIILAGGAVVLIARLWQWRLGCILRAIDSSGHSRDSSVVKITENRLIPPRRNVA